MNLTEALHQLADLHAAGSLTDDEFAAAKARLLASATDASQPETASKRQIELLRAEAAIARLDREWQIEREKYMTSGNFGYRMMPSKTTSILIGCGALAFTAFWIYMAGSTGAPTVFKLWGVLCVTVAIVQAYSMYRKACAYEVAEKRYQTRRAELLASADLPR
jgi:hypothetical protein